VKDKFPLNQDSKTVRQIDVDQMGGVERSDREWE
jgi:hypothetical protein